MQRLGFENNKHTPYVAQAAFSEAACLHVDSMQDAQCKMQRMVYYNPAECLRIVWSGKDTH